MNDVREIEFRGKRKDNGEWVYGFYGYKHDGDRHFIMQEDKKGQHICEGDIVNHRDFSIGFTANLNITGVVKMVEGSWCVERGDNGEFLFTETGTNEIIGNIYETWSS